MSMLSPPPLQRDFIVLEGGRYTVDPIWLKWFLDQVTTINTLNAAAPTAAALVTTVVTMTNGAGAAIGTLNNSPAAGDPTKWVPFDDNGTIRYIPTW